MDQPKKISAEQLPPFDEAGGTGARRRAWTTPELIKMDIVDSTRDGNVPRTHAEGGGPLNDWYQLVS